MRNLTFALFSILAMLVLPSPCHADSADSLYQVLKNDQHANYKVANSLMIVLDAEGIADSLYTFNSDDQRSYILKTIALYMAYHYDAQYNYALAANAFMEMARQARLEKNMAEEGDALSQAAVEYHRLGEFDQAIKVNLQALHIDSLLNDTALLSNDLSTLAATCLTANRTDDAVQYILMAIEKEESLPHPKKLSIRYGHAAEIFNKKGDLQQALQYAEMAYELDRKAGNEVGTARRLSQMADIYINRGEWRQAETYYLRAIDILEKKQERHSLTICYKQIGVLYLKQGYAKMAVDWLLKADSLAAMTGNKYFRSQTVRYIAKAYADKGEFLPAYEYLTEGINLNDSIYNERLEQLATNLRMNHEQEEQRLAAEHQKAIVSRQQYAIIALAVLFVALAAFCVYLYKRHKKQLTNGFRSAEDGSLSSGDTDQKGIYLPMKNMSAVDRQFILNVVDYVHNNMKVRKITIDLLAEEMCMSRSQFSRRITALTKETPNAFITRIRIEKATRLLKDTNMSVKEIAYDCGFDESNYFIRVFRQMYDMTPQQYRNTPL